MKIANPPLEMVTFQFSFPTLKSIPIDQITELINELQEEYPKKPEVILLQSSPIKTPATIELTPPSPMRFISKDKNRSIHLFSDKIVFRFKKYDDWDDTRDKIMRDWEKLVKILKIDNFNIFTAEYVDIFKPKRHNFKLKDYFTMNVRHSENWEIDFEDFHLGVRIKLEDNGLFVIRIRGVTPDEENKYKIRLEWFYRSKDTLREAIDFSKMKEDLEDFHNKIKNYFYEMLAEKTKKIIGVMDDE